MTVSSNKSFLSVIFASATLTIMAGSIIAPVLNLMRDSLGITPSFVGLIITTHGLFMAIASPLMGTVIDRTGARSPYIIALICYGLAGGSGLLINSFWFLLLSRACLGIALACIFTSINVLILDKYEGLERDKIMGWRGSAQSLGGVLWPLIGGILGGFSWHFPFAVYMIAIPIALFAIKAVSEPAIQHQVGPNSSVGTSVLRIFMETPILLIIYGLMFSGNILLYVIVIFLPQLLEIFGTQSTFKIGLYITTMTSFAGVTSFVYAKIRSRFDYRIILITGTALWTGAFTTISHAPDSLIFVMAVAMFGVSQGMIMPTIMVWIGDIVPVPFRGRFSSYLGTFGYIGQFLSPILFAPVFMLVGLKGVFMVGAGIGATWFLILLFVSGRVIKIKKSQ